MSDIIKVDGATMLNPYVRKFFFQNHEMNELPLNEYYQAWAKFLSDNSGIIQSLNEKLRNNETEFINEALKYGCNKEQVVSLTEAMHSFDEPTNDKEEDLSTEEDEDEFFDDSPVIINKEAFDEPNQVSNEKMPLRNVIRSLNDVRIIHDEDDKYIDDVHCVIETLYNDMIILGKNGVDEEGNKVSVNETVRGDWRWLKFYDTSKVHNMKALFAFMEMPNADLSDFDVTGCTNANGMFFGADFLGKGIENWKWKAFSNMIGTNSEVREIRAVLRSFDMFGDSTFKDYDKLNAWKQAYKNLACIVDAIQSKGGYSKSIGMIKRAKAFANNKGDYKRVANESRTHKYVLSSSEFINEGFRDTVRNAVKSAKNFLSNAIVKMKDGITLLFDEAGQVLNVNSVSEVIDRLRYSHKKGVIVNGYEEKQGYYGEATKEEMRNYAEFIKNVNKMSLNEARVAMSAKQTDASNNVIVNIGASDVNDEQLGRELKKSWFNLQKHNADNNVELLKPLCVWGAPGIGKTTIVKRAAKEFEGDTTFICIDCSQLTSDGFDLPVPGKEMKVEDILKESPEFAKRAKELGLSASELGGMVSMKSDVAPKTWLPVYKVTGDAKKDALLDDIANSFIKEKDGKFIKTTQGGVLFFDEFLRTVNNDLNFKITQIALERMYMSEYKLGSKWMVVFASNRPTESNMVQNNYSQAGEGALFSRIRSVNFVPDFASWRKWATTYGGFGSADGQIILDWISNGGDVDGESSRFHNVDPEQLDENETRFITPRVWASFMDNLQNDMEFAKSEGREINDIHDLGRKEIERTMKQYFPDTFVEKFLDYFMRASQGNYLTYESIISDNPMSVSADKRKETGYVRNVINIIANKWDEMALNSQLPSVDEVERCANFLCNNFPTNVSIILKSFYQELVDKKIIGVLVADNKEALAKRYYKAIWSDIFMKKFPEVSEEFMNNAK